MDKIRRAGVPLEEYAGSKPYRGVLTGCNEAFLIDTPTRDALVAEDPGSAEIIKPYLRGQDIERWYAPWQDLWMIFCRRGIEVERFPSILAHLSRYRNKLEPRPDDWNGNPKDWPGRKPGNYAWYEIQDSTEYWEIFEKPKLLYQEIQYHARYAIHHGTMFANNKTFILPTSDAFLCAVLNSPLMWWHNWRYLIHLKDEALSPMGYRMERLPVAKPPESTCEAATAPVDQLIAIRRSIAEASSVLQHWYVSEFDIPRPHAELLQPFGLALNDFIDRIRKARGSKKPLSAAGVQALRDEYARTVRPVQVVLREADRLERRLSEMVNEAYGLTPGEVRLMWDTAPPRMPLMPEAEDHFQADVEAVA
jgi:TaqI-like C-terminal specificity domain